jgi:hypothetical protein
LSTKSRIPELQTIDFQGPTSITDYSKTGRAISRDLGEEFTVAADELYQVLIRSFKGHPVLALLGAPDVRMRARRVVKRLKIAAELQAGVCTEMVKFNAQFRKEFIDVLPQASPEKRKTAFNWNA